MLTKGEIIRLITDYIGVSSGYLGDFSYRTLEEFFPVYCDIEVDPSKLQGDTNRYRFQNYLEKSDSQTQIKIIKGVFKKYPPEQFPEESRPIKNKIYVEFLEIIKRLETVQPILTQEDINAHFVKIHSQILEEINNAKFLIWVAVAWFTDKDIFNRLAHRRYEGLNIELILDNNPTNRKSGINYEKYVTTHWMPQNDKLMHHKFCVIDLNTCITGSYNWTYYAKTRNLENITIIKNTQSTLDFAGEFVRIKGEILKNTPTRTT